MTPDKRIVLSRGHGAGNVPQNQSIWRFMENALDTGRCPGQTVCWKATTALPPPVKAVDVV